MTGVFASAEANPGIAGLLDGLVVEQLKAVGLTIVWSVAATTVIAYPIKFTIGLRPTEEVETAGLDLAEHGEGGYEH